MLPRKFFLLILFLCLMFKGFAQIEQKNHSNENSIGITVSLSEGTGLAFKHKNENYGFLITALPFKIKQNFQYSFGLTGFRYLNNFNDKFFLYAGSAVMSDKISDFSSFMDAFVVPFVNFTNSDKMIWNTSSGFGYDFSENPQFSLSIGYGVFDITNNYKLLLTIHMAFYYIINK